ncbi:MAG TPA: hypothetical protein VNH41_01275 [Steroidobacteraceae bacterium]|jgi:hypothetical protein|nr:hypothetical protein [Steroidobacteraceae bacterium]
MSMTRFLILPALLVAALPLVVQAQNVSFNATISGQVVPGVYGQVAIGNGPPPPVVYAQPMIAQPAPIIVGAAPVEPIYLHVPPGHAKNWHKHCHEYHACERPVYFVKSAEYQPGYQPEHHGHGHHDEDGDDHDHGHGHHHD